MSDRHSNNESLLKALAILSLGQKGDIDNANSYTSTGQGVPEIVIEEHESDKKGAEQVTKVQERKDDKMEAEEQKKRDEILLKSRSSWPPKRSVWTPNDCSWVRAEDCLRLWNRLLDLEVYICIPHSFHPICLLEESCLFVCIYIGGWNKYLHIFIIAIPGIEENSDRPNMRINTRSQVIRQIFINFAVFSPDKFGWSVENHRRRTVYTSRVIQSVDWETHDLIPDQTKCDSCSKFMVSNSLLRRYEDEAKSKVDLWMVVVDGVSSFVCDLGTLLIFCFLLYEYYS